MERALFIDLDGTLMKKGFIVSPRNKESLVRALDAGFKVIITSGRPIAFVKYLAKTIDSRIDSIGFNGAYSENLIDKPIEFETIKEIIEILKSENVSVLYKTKDMIYATNQIIDSFVYPISEHEKARYKENTQVADLEGKKIYKVLGIYNENNEKTVSDKLKQLNVHCALYLGKGFELANVKVNKGNAIQIYCLKNNVSIKESYCFGDDVNDIEMFKQGGINMVMANAQECVKQYANYICEAYNEDGVGKAIEKIVEGEFI